MNNIGIHFFIYYEINVKINTRNFIIKLEVKIMSTLLSNSSNSLLKVCSKLSIRNYMKYLDLNVNSKNCELKSESCFPYMLNSYLFSSLKQNILYISKRYNENFGKDNYSPELENAINEQIKAELDAGYTYLNIATYFGRSIVALPGLHGFFMKMFYEELEHGLAFTKYQNLRGGLVKFSPLQPVDCDWSDIPSTFKTALNMEKDVKKVISYYSLFILI